uniref:Poly [ADP-ribose] polymerase n=1 Tax=Zooxanthella nutricula TaxID=1333877 RepID=A0A7S2MVG3_9DINO
MSPFTAPLAQRTVREVQETLQSDRDYPLPACVNKAKEVRTKLRSPVLAKSFDESFWLGFRPWYDRLVAAEATSVQTKAVEWAAAFSEQLGQPLPPWMMNKDQMEALKLMQAALHGGSEDQLRQAVVFAKQADYKSDHQLVQMYDEAVLKLKKLKRLPSGWEVTDLLGDEAGGKMFKKVDLKGDAMHGLFQQLLDSTNAGIVTRDRAGAMPRGYRLEKVETVWNVDSWGLYMKRVDAIKEQCGRFEGAAPVKDWSRWSGEVATATIGSQILSEAKLPPLMGSANEFLMFHGTKPEAAHSIAENHFDMAFACKTGLFGAGVYLCESSSKSDEYVKPNDKGHFPTIVCRVALGRVNYIASADPTTDPGRDKMEGSCLRGDYHSVLGDRKKVRGTYREFIIYDHYQVYPHFIVWYSRIG